MNKTLLAACVAASLCAAVSVANAQAKITLENWDSAGLGLNNATSVKPVGGNPGVTLGQQRLIAYQYAMDLWGALLKSDTETRVGASFAPLTCMRGYILLGSASPAADVIAREISPDGAEDYAYLVALANAIGKRDFTPGREHIATMFSSAVDEPGCQAMGARGWYYGLTGNDLNEQGGANFLNVVMHEIGHGLGFSGNSSPIYRWVKGPWDGLAWSSTHAMSYNDFDSDDVRMPVALTMPGQTVWTGRASRTAALLAENRLLLKVRAPVAASYDFNLANFGSTDLGAFSDNQVVLVNDAAPAAAEASHLGCDGDIGEPLISNGKALEGKIVLIDRGVCDSARKALNAQNHGAKAVIIANDVDDDMPSPGGGRLGGQVRIPVIGVSMATGAALRGDAAVVTAVVVSDPGRFYGLDSNKRLRLYTPANYEGFSHVDKDMWPNGLMEPAENKTLRADITIDVALEMLEDMGWPTNRNGTAKLAGCDTTVPVYRDTFIPGANLIAHNNMCRNSSAGNRAKHLRCMNDQIASLHQQSLITSVEMMKARQCVAKL